MNNPTGRTDPLWYDTLDVPPANATVPDKSLKSDVAVIGAGIAGLTSAYLALKAGLTVAVFDENPVGSGQTGKTSAHLASAIDDRFFEVERLHGVEAARLAYESHAGAIDTIERICGEEKINCDFTRVDGFLFLSPHESEEYLDKEFKAAERASVADVELVLEGPLNGGRCIRFDNQARFQPLAYLLGLVEAIQCMGGHLFIGTRVTGVQGSDPAKRAPARTKLHGVRKTFESQHIVVATNTPSPINDWFGIYTKQASYRSYVIAVEVPRGSVPDALYWDTGDPYHYVRLERAQRGTKDRLIVGGEDHKTGQFPEGGLPFENLERWARSNFDELGKVTHRWSGQVQEPADGLGFLGRAKTAKQEVFVITGDSGMGLTHATIGAMLINDLIAGRDNPWEKLYDPSRKMINREFVRENANTAAQYVDLVMPGDVKSEDAIPPGEGAVLREGIHKIAAYRDPAGKLHKCSAVCTHLQCIVQWNRVEESWDCPCHGSRFDPKGKVLVGPAVEDLPAL